MASVKKFAGPAVLNQIRHIERTIDHPANEDIDRSKIDLDYIISPDRGMSSYDYFLQRKSELYCYHRDDVKVLAGWIITKPKSLPPEEDTAFFQSSYNFLIERYGEENCVSCVVHRDESGEDHLYFLFIPVVEDKKHGGEKICANDVLNKKEMRNFHPDLQRHLNNDGLHANVNSGITKRQGGNKTVAQLKKERTEEMKQEQIIERRGRWG